jgi:hypothetical protein
MILDLLVGMGKQTSGGSLLSSFLGSKPTTGASGLGAEAAYDTPTPTTFGERMGQGLKGMSTTNTSNQQQKASSMPKSSTNIGRFNQPTSQPNTQNMLTQMLIQMLQKGR